MKLLCGTFPKVWWIENEVNIEGYSSQYVYYQLGAIIASPIKRPSKRVINKAALFYLKYYWERGLDGQLYLNDLPIRPSKEIEIVDPSEEIKKLVINLLTLKFPHLVGKKIIVE